MGEIEGLLSKWRSSREGFERVEAVYTLKQTGDPESAAQQTSMVPILSRKVIVDLGTGRYVLREDATTQQRQFNLTVSSFDGRLSAFLVPHSKSGTISGESKASRSLAALLPFLALSMSLPPEEGGSGIDDGSLSSLLSGATSGKIEITEQQVDGRSLIRFRGPKVGPTMIEVDINGDRGFQVVRTAHFNPQINALKSSSAARETFVSDFLEVTNHHGRSFWIPTEVTSVTRSLKGTEIRQVITVDKSTVVINGAEPEFGWSVPFPPGTQVLDSVSGKSFRTGESDSGADAGAAWVLPIAASEVRSFLEGNTQEGAASGSRSEPVSALVNSSFRWAQIAAGGFVITAMAVLVWRMLKSPKVLP